MKIETKYDVGDKVWYVYDYTIYGKGTTIRAMFKRIIGILIFEGKKEPYYHIDGFMGEIPEKELLSNKDKRDWAIRNIIARHKDDIVECFIDDE